MKQLSRQSAFFLNSTKPMVYLKNPQCLDLKNRNYLERVLIKRNQRDLLLVWRNYNRSQRWVKIELPLWEWGGYEAYCKYYKKKHTFKINQRISIKHNRTSSENWFANLEFKDQEATCPNVCFLWKEYFYILFVLCKTLSPPSQTCD